MKTETLTDEKGYSAQVNVVKVLASGKKVAAGEDGLIKVVEKGGLLSGGSFASATEKYLEKITSTDGWLVNIEDVAEFENGDLVVACTDGEVAIYIYNKNTDTYTLGKIKTVTTDDCLYYVDILEPDTIQVWGEKNIKLSLSLHAF